MLGEVLLLWTGELPNCKLKRQLKADCPRSMLQLMPIAKSVCFDNWIGWIL